MSQTTKFVDEQENRLHEDDVQSGYFTRTPDVVDQVTGDLISKGTWDSTSHTFNSVIAPVIPGLSLRFVMFPVGLLRLRTRIFG
ncbi:MAG: mucin-binding protein [Limosilactobacillus pontis]